MTDYIKNLYTYLNNGINDEDTNENSIEDSIEDKKVIEKHNKVLENIFKNNINQIPDKDILEKTKNDIKTKKDANYFLNAIELLNKNDIEQIKGDENYDYDYLYPHLDDKDFNIKIFNKEEFNEHALNIKIDKTKSIETMAEKICNKEFSLAPHQLFLKNFLSKYTPYNSLLLYHGLGTGKTCSAIGIAEETREFLKLNNINSKILIIASPKVQRNFRLQLFDDRKLKYINGIWSLNNCAGNNLLKDINNLKIKISKEKVIKIIDNIINNFYEFKGYIEFANDITKLMNIDMHIPIHKRQNFLKLKFQKYYGNRLIIIDEIHNIRETSDESNKIIVNNLMTMVKFTDNVKLVLLSATPMFNSYKEIIYIINLLNLNDRRSKIDIKDVFDDTGNLLKDNNGYEIGKEVLKRKLNGYISYVKGDNPLTFPFRILPELFSPINSLKNIKYPINDLLGNPITNTIKFTDLYMNKISPYQEKVYNYILLKLFEKNKTNLNSIFKYTELQKPLISLNIVYPNNDLIELPNEKIKELDIDINNLISRNAFLENITFVEETNPPSREKYEFIDKNTPNIFTKDNIGKYSCKIKNILDSIHNSKGPIILYSQFIDDGIIPLSLALEANGFRRYETNTCLFKNPPTDELDIKTYKFKSQLTKEELDNFKPAKYITITGDHKYLTPKKIETEYLKAATNDDNCNGEIIKIILLSKAGNEGLDFKCIRQIHILEPWYNLNRLEQTIGRGVRNCSHKNLPFRERNVEIFLHATLLENNNIESTDLLLYRKSEEKAILIGNVTRVLKELSIDCLLNIDSLKFTEKNLKTIYKKPIEIILSHNNSIRYRVGDKANTALCDYMDNCEYVCNNSESQDDINLKTYNTSHLELNNFKVIKIIKHLFKEKFFYDKKELILLINSFEKFSYNIINNTLNEIVTNNNYIFQDKYNTSGKIINIGKLYVFQPNQLNNNNSSLYSKTTPIYFNDAYISIKNSNDITENNNITNPNDKNIQEYNIENIETLYNELYTTYLYIEDGNLKNINNMYKTLPDTHFIKILTSFIKMDKIDKNNIISYNNINLPNFNYDLIHISFLRIIICNMLLDNLNNSEKILLYKYINDINYEVLDEKSKTFIENIGNYFKKYIIEINKKQLLIFYESNKISNNNYTINLIDKPLDTTIITKGDYEDYIEYNDIIINKFKISDNKRAPVIGFIENIDYNIHKQNYVFKLKNYNNSSKQFNPGSICKQIQPKTTLINDYLKNIVPTEIFDKIVNKDKTTVNYICIIIELYIRYNQIIQKNKFWFFDTNYSKFNNFYLKKQQK